MKNNINFNEYKFPKIVHLETTNVCNLKCIHCPQSNLESIPNYQPKMMALETYEKVAKEVGQHNGILRLTPNGEPMVHPDWCKQVEIALDSNVDIFCFNTNGLLLEGENLEVLFRETTTRIAVEISIDALYQNSYQKIRGGDYTKLLRNIFSFIHEVKKRKKDNIKILVSCVVQPELQESEFEQFERFWSPIVDKVIKRNYVDTKGLTPHKPEVQFSPEERWPCPVVFTRLVISVDGGIRFCPDDWLETTTIGNIDTTNLLETWSSEYMASLRKSHIDGCIEHKTCKNCTDWTVIRWGNDYIKALDDLFFK